MKESERKIKAGVLRGQMAFSIDDYPIPKVEKGELLVKTKAVGICGTDIHKAYHLTVPVGTVLGHEISGVVEKVGDGVVGFKEGDRVAIQHHAPCMSCKQCLKGHHSLCDQYLKTNVIPGGFSEYIKLMPENVKHTVKHLPENLSFIAGAFMEPLSCCLRGFHRLRFDPGDNYLVIGLGPIGMLFCQIARAFNAGSIIGMELDNFRKEFALNELKVDAVFNPKEDQWEDFMKENDIRDFDHVIITVGIASVYQDALARVSKGTNVLFFAECPADQEIHIDPNLVYRNELTLIGSYSSSPRFLTMAIDMMSNGSIRVDKLVSHEFPLADLEKGMQLARAAKDSLKVMITF
ncbi:MAG: alcohol dehydrogenase catalytic domain-containing protein [Promethearchaeota archaeon]